MLEQTADADEAITRLLRSTPAPVMPPSVLARLRSTIAGEVALRNASRVEPDDAVPDLKPTSPLWQDDPVTDA
ncbi:MAG: hypothetical protein R2703_10385 [Micropruina glycogenica]|jgi:hypothetical protein